MPGFAITGRAEELTALPRPVGGLRSEPRDEGDGRKKWERWCRDGMGRGSVQGKVWNKENMEGKGGIGEC